MRRLAEEKEAHVAFPPPLTVLLRSASHFLAFFLLPPGSARVINHSDDSEWACELGLKNKRLL